MRTQVGTFLAQRGFVRHAQLDRGINLTCINTGGRGRYRTADRWCVKGQDRVNGCSGVSNTCSSACPLCPSPDRCVHIRSGTSWDTDGTLANGCAPVSRRPDRGDPVKLPIGWPGLRNVPMPVDGARKSGKPRIGLGVGCRFWQRWLPTGLVPKAPSPQKTSAGHVYQSRRRGRRHVACRAGRYPDAQRLAEAVVAADPLREAMWRTLMRVRSAVGDYDGVVSTFAMSTRATGRRDRARGGHPCPAGPAAPLNTRFGAFTSGRRH